VKALIITVLTCFCFIAGLLDAARSFVKGKRMYACADTIPASAEKLIRSYPNFVAGFMNNYLTFVDGSKLQWDDGLKNKSAKLLLNKPDIEDMFNQKYTTGASTSPPARNFDPGRIRNQAFFFKDVWR